MLFLLSVKINKDIICIYTRAYVYIFFWFLGWSRMEVGILLGGVRRFLLNY